MRFSEREAEHMPGPCLTFSAKAWLKLQYFCHAGETEIGGFAVTNAKNLLYVEDFVSVQQRVSWASVDFDDHAVADLFDRCVDQGLKPCQFSRIWCHTHPGSSAEPSGTDEETFARCFGQCDWSLMFILSRTGATYARLRFQVGPGATLLLPVRIDWSTWARSLASDGVPLADTHRTWQEEFERHVQAMPVDLDPSPWWAQPNFRPPLDASDLNLTQETSFHEFDPFFDLRP